ncbi:hypothetical protein [Herbidospora mongoliensis]|uniref:hypothetical protein n=1 Tax=Herbidospora mongoliensis TaxID=688067 RepID=UPI00083733A1|nr:hypothetical protein [Herbidospora mongoliensis]
MPDESERHPDERLLAELTEAVSRRRHVPREAIEAGKAAFGLRGFDAEIAQLVIESAALDGSLLLRAETAALTSLTFQSAHLRIDLGILDDALIGQLDPDEEARVEVRGRTGGTREVAADEVGGFTIRPIPKSGFHLYVRTASGLEVVTTWVTL